MKKQVGHRKYNFPDADLYLMCMETIKSASKDMAAFVSYGYDKSRLKTFQKSCDKFRSMPDDDELVGDQMIVTDKKKAAAEKLKTAIRSVMTRVSIKYGNRSGRYRKFGTAKMGDMTDAQLLFCGRRVARVARAQIDFLTEVGVNEKNITRVTEACRNFENALNIQHDKVSDRDIAVENRIDQGNKIYDELIVLCNIGKDIYAATDRVKYDFYTIYESNNEQKIKAKTKKAKGK